MVVFLTPWRKDGSGRDHRETQSSLGAPLDMWFGVTPAPVPKASFAPKAILLLLLEVGSEPPESANSESPGTHRD